ncbi:MAG: SDR family NAD(P)-dependent oxidoreductase [Rubrivivax sp.]|nr:SDR family NAD(P)-dependent oxidoreductase [Rubrivivax sp.]
MYAPFDLTGHGAVVTGGNGGIGLGMARALLAAGARVAIWGSNAGKTERARAQLACECGERGDPAEDRFFCYEFFVFGEEDQAAAAAVA